LVALGIALFAGVATHAGEVARGDLTIVGLALEVDRNPVSAATGVPSFVQTLFGGRSNENAPAIPGLAVFGDLTGPGIETPITLSTTPGKKFAIPALMTKGEYTLQNIRLTGTNGEFLQTAVPSFAAIHVSDALQTRVRVRQLTADELRERGILIDQRNFDVYEFTFIVGVEGSEVEIPYPVVIHKYSRTIEPLGPQGQSPPPPPKNGPRRRFTAPPPQIFDIGAATDLPPVRENDRDPRIAPPRLPAALVVPTGFGVLHQHFAVILEVSNVSEDATVRLDGITASLRSPLQMRVSKVLPAVAVGQPVPVKDEATGATFLVAGARGMAEWTLEALQAGTHTLDLEVRATYQKRGQEDFPMFGTAAASIVVSDPRFQVNFSHPDVVRKDEPYTAYAFITNQSEQRQHVVLDTSHIPSCTSGGSIENLCRTEGESTVTLNIHAGQMVAVPYKLKSTVTGKVFAAAGAASDAAIGVNVRLTMGVSTSGIPLSPATLLLPYYAQYLPATFVDAHLQLLGLGYSLATAPLNKFTARQPRVITSDVFTRAQEIARAGQRVFVSGDERDAFIHLALDLLDNPEKDLALHPALEEWDQLRRQEVSGRRAAAVMARELERTTSMNLVDDFAKATAHRSPFLFAYADDAELTITGLTTSARLAVPAEAPSGWLRELPHGELSRFRTGQLALIGRWTENVRISITPKTAGTALHLLYPDADGKLLRAEIPITTATTFDVQRGTRTLPGTITEVTLPNIALLGAAQDLHLDPSGHLVTLLFNRPPPVSESWRNLISLTTEVAKASYSATRRNTATEDHIPAAIPQSDGRLLNITFARSLSKNATYRIAVEGALNLDVVPRIENDRPGAILTGRVLLPDNTPAANAFVSLTLPDVRTALVQGDLTAIDGRYLFEFVPRDQERNLFGQYELRAQTTDTKVTELAGAVRLPGEVHTVNLVFAGRGRVRGNVRYDDGTPIPNRLVSASSPVHSGEFLTTTDANGNYEMEVGVGPLTFAFVDPDGRITFATNQLKTAGEIITQHLVVLRQAQTGSGAVKLIVRRADTNTPLPNALVAVAVNGYVFPGSWTDANGVYLFRDVPAGVVTLLAEHSDVSAAIEVDLRADQTLEQTIVLDIRNTVVQYATLEGVVTRDDPSAPSDATKDQRVANAVIAIGRAATVNANNDGTYTFTDLPLSLSGAVITVFDPATSRQGWFRVPTLVANTTNRLPLRLSTTASGTATVRVRLYDAQGAIVSGFKVLSPGYPPVTFREKSAGVYENADVTVPRSEAVVAVPANSTYGDQFATGSVRVDFDGQLGVTDLRLPGAGTIAVKLEAGGSQAIGRVALTYAYWDIFSQGLQPKTIELDPDPVTGIVTFAKIPAKQWVTVATVRHPLGYAEERVYLTHDADVRQVVLRLGSASEVSGRVFAHDAITPLPDATVRIITGTASYSAQLSKPDGAFRFSALPANTSFEVIAELTHDGVFRTGMAYGRTPEGGGPVTNVRVTMREQSSIEGRVVDANGNAAPLARYWMRELTWPHRAFGTAQDPLHADIHGRFAITNVFTGPFRITAVAADNQELRGDYQGALVEEGDVSQRNVEVRIGAAGTGSISVTILDPLLGFAPVDNAEVALLTNGQRFDFTSSNENGVAFFADVPAGTYVVTGFSKARVRGGTSAPFSVTANATATVTIQLEFRGLVAGFMSDPDSQPTANARVPAMPVTIRGPGYEMRDSTNADGEFELTGVPEGEFQLFGYEIGTERIAQGPTGRFISRLVPEHRDIHLQLERFAKLNVKVYLPNDSGGPGQLVPLSSVDACQCNPLWGDYQYMRAFQGNPVAFERMIHRRPYSLTVQELGGEGRRVIVHGAFPDGVYEHEQIVVLPASGSLEVAVRDGGGNAVADAAVHIITQGRVFDVYSDTNGLVSLHGIAFGWASATAQKGSVTAAASGTVASRNTPLRLTLNLGNNISVSGLVEAETPANTPSANTRVVLTATSRLLPTPLRLETMTDANGAFAMSGIPVGGTSLDIRYYGADDTTIGAHRAMAIADSTTGNVALPSVRLDATPPRVLSIEPPANSTNVSPTTNITITFSEQFNASFLTASYFQLRASDDGTQVPATIQTSVRPDKTFVVKIIPAPAQPFPLRSNVLYRFSIAAGIRDLTGNAMTTPVGTSFTTVNYSEPAIVSITPGENQVLVEGQTFRIKFNKAISLASFDAGNGGIAVLDRLDAHRGSVVAPVTVTRFLDPADPSTLVLAPQNEPIVEGAFYRLTIAGVRDTSEPPNVQRGTRIVDYAAFDRVDPVARIVSPVAAGEKLISGVLYTATVDVGGATDVAYVDWLDASGVSIARANAMPFAYSFVAPSNATTFTLKASATDLSFNSSAVDAMTWDVAPNEAPRDIVVTHTPLSSYAGKQIETRVSFRDEGLSVVVALALNGMQLGSQKITRASTSEPFADAVFRYTLPLALPDGPATIIATATDSVNKSGTGEAAVTILADTIKPAITSFLPSAESRFRFGESFVVDVVAADAETGLARAVFNVGGVEVFNGAAPFRHTVVVPPKNADTRVPITVTLFDHRGNSVSETHEVIYERVDDSTVPTAAWITPLDGAALPSNQPGWLATLRIQASDDVKVTSVRFESTALAAPITLTAPTAGDVFEAKAALSLTDGTPVVVKAIVSDGDPSHDVELPITIHPVAVAPVISADINISSLVADQYANKSVLVRGARVYVTVPLTFTNLILVDGATLSNPEGARLDLAVTNRFFLDATSSVDLNERGMPASGATNADASHAGIGGSSYGATNATYGSITDPADFGRGGSAGGNGGGAMKLVAGTLVIAGPIHADGGGAPARTTAGSGGSIDLRAAALITSPLTRITANGGDAVASNEVDRGGGGGRIAIRAPRLDAAAGVLQARGGRNANGIGGGAGTIFVNGALTVSAFDEREPASTRAVMGTPIAGTFDAITIGPRALGRFDAAPSATPTVHATGSIALPNDLPTVTLNAAGGNVIQHTTIHGTVSAASANGIREVRTILDAVETATYPRFVTSVSGAATSLLVPHTAPTGNAAFKVRVTDRAGRVAESAAVPYTIVANAAPTIDTFVAPAESHAGRTLSVTATASDDVAVTSLTLASSIGTVTNFNVAIPPATVGGTDITLTLSATDNFPGRAATTATRTVRILTDTVAPALTVIAPLNDARVQEGSGATFVVEVNTSDAEVAVQRVTATLDGSEYALTFVSGTTWRATVPVPNVDAAVVKTLTITSADYANNIATVTQSLHVDPLLDPNAPALQWVCTSPGAMAPAGYELSLRVSAIPSSSANGVAEVRLSINGAASVAMTSIGANLYESKYTIPAGTPDGTRFDVRVAARSVANNESTLLGDFFAVTGTEIATASFIDATDTAFENQSIIVRNGGVLTVAGAHHLRNLVVLRGGTLIQQQTDRLSAERIFFECGGTADMNGRGFTRNTTIPGASLPDYQSAGSHIGRGSMATRTAGSTFGSITAPREAGGGGHIRAVDASGIAGAGGGVLRLHANTTLTIDGALKANGVGSNLVGWGGGAGGSIWLSTNGQLSGGGTIEAAGGTSSNIRSGGGGGAIAIEYGSASGSLLANATAAGGWTPWGAYGGAGSLFTRAANATLGELTIDNKGLTGLTELPSFGRATIASISGNSVRLQNVRFVPPSLVGHHLRSAARTYRITAITNDVTPVNGFFDVLTQDAADYDGFLLYSPQGIAGRTFIAARYTTRWEYDDGTTFTPFNPRTGDSVIASFRKAGGTVNQLTIASCCLVVHDLPTLEVVSGEILPNAVGGMNADVAMETGVIDDAEFFLRNLILGNGTNARLTLDDVTALAAGAALQGVYRFDKLTLKTAVVTTGDLVEAPRTLDAASSLITGNATTPALTLAGATIERGLDGAVLVAPANAALDADGADVLATNATRGSAPQRVAWNRMYYVEPGTRGGLSLSRLATDRGGPYGVSTLEPITSSGYVSFTPSQRTAEIQAGLAPIDTTRAIEEPGIFAFRLLADARYEIWANGNYVPGRNGTYTETTVFRIEKTPRALRYLVNGVRVHEVTASLPTSLRLDVTVRNHHPAELHSIEYDTTSEHGFRARVAAATDGSFRIPLRGQHGDTVNIAARDRHRLAITSAPAAVTIPNDIGVASIALASSELLGGRTTSATVTLLASAGSEGALVELTSNHASVTVPSSITIAPNASSGTFTITTTTVAAATDVTVGATYGGNGTAAVLRVVPDVTAPTIVITSPAANAAYTELAKIPVRATVTDSESGVKQVRATLGTTTVLMTKSSDTYSADLTAPSVDGNSDAPATIVLAAEDNNGNNSNASVAVIIKPDGNQLLSLTAPSAITTGTTAYGTLRLTFPAGSAATVSLTSSNATIASVPATVTISAGSATAQFAIAANATGSVTITATYESTRSASLAITAADPLASLTIDSASVEGGAVANGTITLAAPAPAGGAIIALASSDTARATVPGTVTIAEGATSASFAILTTRVSTTSNVTITATWGNTRAAALTLIPCASMGSATAVTTPPATIWFDDAVPANATATGTATFDTTQAASGTQSLHFAPATTVREWSFTGATALAASAGHELVLHALVNPCNPPRQIAVTFSGSTAITASWGESRIDTLRPTSPIPAGGTWQRLALRVPASATFTALTIKVDGGEAWFDLAGTGACTTAPAAPPQRHASEVTWFEQTLPAGATGTREQFIGATNPMSVAPGDVLFAWVLVDPCNPPRELLLQFHDGANWDHRAYFGNDLLAAGTHATRRRIGPLPRAGEWVRLEIPAWLVRLDEANVHGFSFTAVGGNAQFGAVGRMQRVNVARAKTATQSSTHASLGAANAVDGNIRGDSPTSPISHTIYEAQPWWQADLGQSQPIEAIQLWNRTDCCAHRTANFWIFLSDTPFTTTTVAATLSDPNVRALRYYNGGETSMYVSVARRARYVRVQLDATEALHLAEVQVWAPVEAMRTNLAVGSTATSQSSTFGSGFESYRAVDGHTRPDWPTGAVTGTHADAQAWWQIDLGSVQPIGTIDFWTRVDCCLERFDNVWLFVSDAPFASTSVAGTLAQANVSAYSFGTIAPAGASIDVGRSGRYVRVQRTNTDNMTFVEMQIWSRERVVSGLVKETPDE
jgi:hypothetical protein